MRIIATAIVLFVCLVIHAQQLPQFRQFILAPSVYNPAAMAFSKENNVSLSGRWQMSGFGYEPRTVVLHGKMLIKKKPKLVYNPGSRIQRDYTPTEKKKNIILKHFVGGQVVSDNYGAFRFLELNGNYALQIPINATWRASVGARLGLRNNTFLPTQGVVLNVLDPQIPYAGGDATYDDFINNHQRSMSLSSAVGIGVENKKWYVSAAVMHAGLPNTATNTISYFDPRMHWTASLGYRFPVASGLEIQPSLLVKKMGAAPYSFEFSTLATINYMFWAGFNYQHGASAGVMAGLEVSGNLKIGYALDFGINRLNYFSNGGHEIFLSYGF
ncbi:MAG: type IX secretion system membrane protein PorP/SprF [Flavobacteriia bacterium]|nr:type IX secretion system membrane protein PorP/SprF [Flavobacteriia bacterium]